MTIENPERSAMWNAAAVRIIKDLCKLKEVTFDQCATGSMHRKSTTLLTNRHHWFTNVPSCPGHSFGHRHIALKGMLQYDALTLKPGSTNGTKTKVKIWKTSLAQTYGMGMCQWMAETIVPKIWGINRPVAPPINEWGTQFSTSFDMIADPQKRKRKLYDCHLYPVSLKPNRYAAHMVSSGTQPKRGRTAPVFEKELQLGQAIQRSMSVRHPLLAHPTEFDEDVDQALHAMVDDPKGLVLWRDQQLQYWARISDELLHISRKRIDAIPHAHLRMLYGNTKAPDHSTPFIHIALLEAMANWVQTELPQSLCQKQTQTTMDSSKNGWMVCPFGETSGYPTYGLGNILIPPL